MQGRGLITKLAEARRNHLRETNAHNASLEEKLVVQQLSVYWSVDLDAARQSAPAASPGGQSLPPAWEPGQDSEQQQHEDLILQPMDGVLVLKLHSAGARRSLY